MKGPTVEITNVDTTRDAGIAPPAWVLELMGDGLAQEHHHDSLTVSSVGGPRASLVSVAVPDASRLDASHFERNVIAAYDVIAATLAPIAPRNPVRFWNYIPAIHRPLDARRDRYMVFNAGRYRAFLGWYGSSGNFDQRVPTASGIGHGGNDLVIHCLASVEEPINVANPRQVQPHCYSQRYGPLPPCFARATVLREQGAILVGGTASIRGEVSLHPGDLEAQFHETTANLASIVRAAHERAGIRTPSAQQPWLSRFHDLQIYYPRPGDLKAINELCHAAFAGAVRIDTRLADLCRPELLVEIEGVASLSA